VRRESTTSKYSSKLARIRPPIVSSTSLDYTSAKSGKGILSILSILNIFESQVRIWSILSGPVIQSILSDIASTI